MTFTRVIVLALALTHAVGVAELVRRATCEEECRDDGCEDDCGPGETACACHCPPAAQLLATPTAQLVSSIAAPVMLAPCDRVQRVHESPDPREILHVPRPLV